MLAAYASFIKSQKRIACVSKDEDREKAENEIDRDHGKGNIGCFADRDKYHKCAEKRVGYVNYNAVVGFDYKALEIFLVAHALKLVFVKACKAAKLGNLVLPSLDLELVIKIALLP